MQSGGLRTKGIVKQSKKDMPLITVVTVVRNGEKTLEETILSVLKQTYENVEYIIVDGASNDGTLDIVKKYENKIDYWISEPDKGLYDAMNKGAALANGDFIALLNSDDWYELNACEIVVDNIKKVKADVYNGLVQAVDNKDNKVLFISGNTIDTIDKKMIDQPACFISKKIYQRYKYDIKYKYTSDYDFIIKLQKDNVRFCFIGEVITNFRNGGISNTIVTSIEILEIKKKYGFI